MKSIIISVDIGGSHIAVSAIDGKNIIPNRTITLPVNSKGSANEILTTWSSAIKTCIKAVSEHQVIGLGIAMPGAFDYQTGIALFEETDKYNSLYGLDIRKELRSYLCYPDYEIRFINDATAFAMGASLFEFTRDQSTLVIVLGTGFGTALIRGNKPILKGKNVPADGCFWHIPYKDGIADDYFSTRWLINRYKELSGKFVSGVLHIARVYDSDELARKVFDEFGSNLGDFLSEHLANLSIETVLFGGKIANALPFFKSSLEAKLEAAHLNVSLKKSTLIDEATLIGSSLLFDDLLWQDLAPELPRK